MMEFIILLDSVLDGKCRDARTHVCASIYYIARLL